MPAGDARSRSIFRGQAASSQKFEFGIRDLPLRDEPACPMEKSRLHHDVAISHFPQQSWLRLYACQDPISEESIHQRLRRWGIRQTREKSPIILRHWGRLTKYWATKVR
jgi:hypothetical protein